jgi:hypothetical protein
VVTKRASGCHRAGWLCVGWSVISVAEREDRCLHAVVQVELGEDVAHVRLDGLFADV